MKDRIALYNLEAKYKNIALEKIRLYYEGIGAEVVDYMALEKDTYDMVFASSIFSFTNKCTIPPGAIVGGTGIDPKIVLPGHIDKMKPLINVGFTTRGCIRNCSYCVVRKKEGYFKVVGDLLDIWDRKARLVVLLDNNILADPAHFEMICKQALQYKLKLDINQGLDYRLLTSEAVGLLKLMKHRDRELRFAFDDPGHIDKIKEAIKILKRGGINRVSWYVLVGYNTTYEEDVMRLEYLRSAGQRVYVMKYAEDKKRDEDLILNTLARWGNQQGLFYAKSLKEFALMEKNGFTYKPLMQAGLIK